MTKFPSARRCADDPVSPSGLGRAAVRAGRTETPLAIDLYAGLGGWTEGLLAEGYRVVGFDNARHIYGEARYPAQLVIQDVLTLHGSQFKDAALIVASPPCQEYSYMAMPWKRAKTIAAEYRSGVRDVADLTRLFDACFRIQREACEAAGHHIPLVVENVCGAQRWVGRARWHYGSFYLWGDVPALMPITKRAQKANPDGTAHSIKNNGGSWFNVADNTTSGHGQNPDGRKTVGHVNKRDGHGHTRHLTNQAERDKEIERVSFGSGVRGSTDHCGDAGSDQQHARSTDVKNGGDWFGSGEDCSLQRRQGSKFNARKAASAHIAKIPLELARHIARAWKPLAAVRAGRSASPIIDS